MSKKISEYTETLDASGFYMLGTKEVNGDPITCKYNLGIFENGVQKTLDYVQGQSNVPAFNINTIYYPGQFVAYNGYIWRFTATHTAGPWDNTDVMQTSLFNELKDVQGGADVEAVTFYVSSEDGLLSVSDKTISISFKDASTMYLTTDANGMAQCNITKGKTYTASVASVTGYITPDSFDNIYANYNKRKFNFVYRKNITSEFCTVTATIYTGPDVSTIIDGTTLDIFTTGTNASFQTATVTNGVATFENVPMGKNCTIYCPEKTGYVTPKTQDFITFDKNVGLNFNYKQIMDASGFLWVADASHGYAEYTIDDFPVADASCIALHVCTETLAKNGADYYVKIDDLTSNSSLVSKQWCTTNIYIENAKIWSSEKPIYDGRASTYYMSSESRALNNSSPAADYANQQTLSIKNATLRGYIGTRDQYNFLISNKTYIVQCFLELGKTFNISGFVWQCLQCAWIHNIVNNTNHCWLMLDGERWTDGYSDVGGNYQKTASAKIIPIF